MHVLNKCLDVLYVRIKHCVERGTDTVLNNLNNSGVPLRHKMQMQSNDFPPVFIHFHISFPPRVILFSQIYASSFPSFSSLWSENRSNSATLRDIPIL